MDPLTQQLVQRQTGNVNAGSPAPPQGLGLPQGSGLQNMMGAAGNMAASATPQAMVPQGSQSFGAPSTPTPVGPPQMAQLGGSALASLLGKPIPQASNSPQAPMQPQGPRMA